MSTIVSGDLSYEELLNIRNDNVGYRSDSSLVKVNLYIEATDAMLGLPLVETEHAGERTRLDPRILKETLDEAKRWLGAQSVRTQPLPVFQPAQCWRDE